jgi:hypothetical protein
MEGAVQDRGTFRGIAATLLALALLAERTSARCFPVRFFVLAILFRAEAIARTFVAREIAADWPDSPCLEDPGARHYGAVDAALLALRLRMLAVVLGALADAEDDCDDRSAGWTAGFGRRPICRRRGSAAAPRRPPSRCAAARPARPDASPARDKTPNPPLRHALPGTIACLRRRVLPAPVI